MRRTMRLLVLSGLACSASAMAADVALSQKEGYDYAPAMKKVARKFGGKPGVLLLLGDSNTIAPQNTAWALDGQGQSEAVKAFLKWSHAGEKGDLDGWTAAREQVRPNSSGSAASGMTTEEFLKGGKNGLPPMKDILQKYNPQLAIYMLGTNDLWQDRDLKGAVANVETALDALLANGTIPILSTLPAFKGKKAQTEAYNADLKKLAEKKKIPLLDLYGEMKALGGDPEIFLETDGIHLSSPGNRGAPSVENFKQCGYLFRCYLNVAKAMEVKARVLDPK